MNPNKCAFGVSAGEFLGFLVHEGGIEVGKKSMKAINEVVPPTNLKELQSLLGKINFVRRFISNLSQKVLPFSQLLKLKKDQRFTWGDEQQKAFDEIKQYMEEPPVLVPPQLNNPFKLYVAADTQTIGSALIQEFEGKERVVAYLSRKSQTFFAAVRPRSGDSGYFSLGRTGRCRWQGTLGGGSLRAAVMAAAGLAIYWWLHH
jgi:hypothetical protein